MIRKPSGRRCDNVRARWHNASLKTSFMVYMLGFLLAALALSTFTASMFTNLQSSVHEDAYELSGLYLYDEDERALVPARSIEIDANGSTFFVQSYRDGASDIDIDDLSPNVSIRDASDYRYTTLSQDSIGDSFTIEESEWYDAEMDLLVDENGIPPENIPEYDELAQAAFDEWLTAHPDSPYADLFDVGDESEDESDLAEGMLASPIGYYQSTPPSAEASALYSLFGVLAFLMFPLWFGLCIFAAAHRFFGKRLRPGLATLDGSAAKIADQNLDFAITYDRNNELGHLATSFETMRASLAESQRALWRTAEERRRLNAAFAHDLRTPLTILKGKIELLDARIRSGNADQEQLTASTEALARQVERLERYVAAMSGLQKLEDRTAVRGDVPFDTIAEGVDDIGQGLAPAADKEFALSASPSCLATRPLLHVDRSIVGEVAENLIGNAMRFARSRVDARLDVRDDALVLVVDDDGPGFSDEALDHGCAPFFSETPSQEHFGLGLNIASLLCERHDGTLLLENLPQGGARVTATFAQRNG